MKDSFGIINIIADAVLAMKVADEEVTRIKTAELSMTLGRHTPTKLVGLSIEGGDGRFVLPDGTLDSSTGNTAFVDSQVSFHKSSSFSKNPRLAFLLSNEDCHQPAQLERSSVRVFHPRKANPESGSWTFLLVEVWSVHLKMLSLALGIRNPQPGIQNPDCLGLPYITISNTCVHYSWK